MELWSVRKTTYDRIMVQNRRKTLKSIPLPTSLFLGMGRKELCVWEEATR